MSSKFNSPMIITLLTALALGSTAHAGDLTVPHSFTAGTKALAEEMNANFAATQTAVNSKQDKLTGACSAGQFVNSVNADGSLNCSNAPPGDVTGITAGTGLAGGGGSGDVTLTLAPGTVSTHGFSFVPSTSTCLYQRPIPNFFFGSIGNYGYFSAGTGCAAYAPVQVPNGVTLSRLSCVVHDNATSATDQITGKLIRTTLADPSYNATADIFSVGPTVNATIPQLLTDTSAQTGTATVDNSLYAYFIQITFAGDSAVYEFNMKLYSCSVSYTP